MYDVTKWAKHHPGGLTTLHRFAGKDATDEMRAFHPDNVIEKKLPLFMIGTVSDPPVATPLQKDFRKLHQQFADAGMLTCLHVYSVVCGSSRFHFSLLLFSLSSL